MPDAPASVVALLDDALAQGWMAGCAVCVRTPDRVLWRYEAGAAELRPRARPVAPDQAWDLASLSKVLATTPLWMRWAGRGWDLDAPITNWLPDAPAGVTVRHCLQHSSGLPAWRPLFEEVAASGRAWGTAATRAWVMAAARTTPVTAPPGTKHTYSDLGFLLLGALAEHVGGDRLDRLIEQEVRAQHGADLRWGWPGAAATEDCPVRGGVVVGTVHDLNAAVMGGIAPHAGLFGSATAVAEAAAWQLRAWCGDTSTGLDPAVVRHFWSAVGPGSHRLGWDSPTPGACSAGPRWPLDGVGHLGFTGCSVWIAPREERIVVVLSNRVHPDIEGGARPGADGPRTRAFRALRPALHTAIWESF